MVWWRRCAVVTLALFGLTTAVPPENVPAGQHFPLSWAAQIFRLPAALADPHGLPGQGHGKETGRSGYAPAAATTGKGGAGRAPKKVAGGLDGYQPFTAPHKTTKTRSDVRGFDAKASRRDASASSATMDDYTNVDGSQTQVYSAGTTNYRAADGSWQKIDPTLVKSGTGWTSRAGSTKVTLSAVPSASASVTLPSGGSAGYDLSGVLPITPKVSGATATYTGILPSTVLQLRAYADGVQQTLVAGSAQDGTAWTYPLHLGTLTAAVAADGTIALTDKAGQVRATFAADPATATLALTTTVDGKPALQVNAVAGLTYPASITTTLSTAGHAPRSTDSLRTTTPGAQPTAASTVHFGGLGLGGKRVASASLHLNQTGQFCTTATTKSITVRKTSGTVLGSSAACAGQSVTVPLNAATVNTAVTDDKSLDVTLQSPAAATFSASALSAAAQPQLVMTTMAANVVPQVDTRYPGNNVDVETLTPQLVTRAHDPDNSPNKGLTYIYTVYTTAGAVVVTSPAVTTPGWVVTAGKLAWNTTYYYTVKVGDTVGTSAESAPFAFTVSIPQPQLTSDLSQNQDAGFDAQNGNYTTSAVDAQVAGAGPGLEISREYNSLDTRRAGAFGQGWSSILDVKATQRYDTGNNVQTVVVTYPDGSDVAFGRNANGTFTPPSGRYATFTAQLSGTTVIGYTLTDKDATQYVFGQSVGSGVFKVTAIIDANGRKLTFTYAANQLTKVTNAAGRSLTITWTSTNPTPAPHVATITTDAPATGGSGYAWQYTYGANDTLTSVCPPGTTTKCTTYEWTNTTNQYANATLNLNPYSYWRLNEAAGTSAASSVLANAGVDNGTYTNVTLGGTPALTGSGSTSAAFNGTNAYVQLPGKLVADGSYQSISMWFKTSTAGGVLFSYSAGSITAGTTASNYTPALYVDKNGYLRGEFWQGTAAPIKSTKTVTDNAWHQVVLSGDGSTQIMYLDGTAQNPAGLSGTISMYQTGGTAYEYIGAGFVGNGWPDHANTGKSPAPATFFNGSISDVAFYAKALTSADATALNSVGTNASQVMSRTVSPEGRVQAAVTMDSGTGKVATVTDGNGGNWTFGGTTISGDSDVYEASVLGSRPNNYWRLGDTGGSTVTATNEVAGDTATYNSVTLGATGPFSDTTAASFDGAASTIALPGTVVPANGFTAGVWFNTTSAGQVLLGTQGAALGGTTSTTAGLPVLWTTPSGQLRGAEPSVNPTGPLKLNIASKCADVKYSGTADLTPIDVFGCNAGAGQNWTVQADGTIRTLGKCLDVQYSGTANSTPIDLYTCNGGKAQQWQEYQGLLRNPNSGKCLADPNSSTTDLTQLILWTCETGHDEQTWTVGVGNTTKVNDGKWHYAAMTGNATSQTLYLDGVPAGASAGTTTMNPGPQPNAYLGAGFTGGGWSGLPANTTSYFKGSLAEAAFYSRMLPSTEIAAHWSASKQAVASELTTVATSVSTIVMPVKTTTVTDPGGNNVTYSYDLINNRQVAETDAMGNPTHFGYDSGGFSNLMYDADGVRTQAIQDDRGNTIQQITCQDQSANKCSSTYYGYYYNAANVVDPRNDVMTTSRDARSASATDNTYLTTNTYDAKGNPLSTVDPLGDATTTSYTDGTTIAAADSGFAPAGLPYQIVNASGGIQTITYYANGDIAGTKTPAGDVTRYTYDNLGRKLTETEVTSTFPAGRTTTYTYDGQGRVLTETDPAVTNRVSGAVHTQYTSDTYDGDGNMTAQTESDVTGGDVARTDNVTYNQFGQKSADQDAEGNSTSYTYDAYGQVATEKDANGAVTAFTTDPEGHVLKETEVGFTGDPDNPTAPTDLVSAQRQYDPAGRLATETDAMGRTTNYTYTDDGLTASVSQTDGTNTFVSEKDTYDAAGNLIDQVTNNGTTDTKFDYDAAGRQYRTTADPAGVDRITTNELSPAGSAVGTTQTDSSGNVLAASDYMYDAEGRPLAQTDYNGNPATTPVARWQLNQTSGISVPDSAGNNPGTATGVTWSTASPAGHTGSAAFNGTTSSKITTANPALDTTRSFTLSAWVFLTSNATNQTAVGQTDNQNGAPTHSPVTLGYSKDNNRWKLLTTYDNTNNYAQVLGTAVPPLNTWTNLTTVYNASTKSLSLYVNNVLQGSTTTTIQPSTGGVTIGGAWWNTYYGGAWNGDVSDVQAYQRALSTTQLTSVYNGTAPAAGAGVSRTSSTVDTGGLTTSTTDPLGNTTNTTYDEGDRPAITTAPAVTAETISGTVTARPVSYVGYDTYGDQTETVDAQGNKTTLVYDRDGRMYETDKPAYTTPGGTTINAFTKDTFDALGQTTQSQDERGNLTKYTYDALGRLTKTLEPNTGVTRTTYDADGEPQTVTDPSGAVSGVTYDYLGRKLTTSQAVRQTGETDTTNYTYNTAGSLQQTQTPSGATEKYTYDNIGEQLTTTDAATDTTTSTYDGLGRVVKVLHPNLSYDTTTYDMLSRATGTASYASGGGAALTSGSSTYDAAGNVLSSTDGRLTATTFTYDPTGEVLSENQPVSSTDSIRTSFGYDLNGDQTRFTDGRQNAFWTTYNSWGLPESTIEPATTTTPDAVDRTWTTTYDAAGEAVSTKAPGNVVQSFGYDSVGDLTSQSGSGAQASTRTRNFGYDLSGRMTSFSSPTGDNTISYDDRGLATSVSGPSGNSSFGYTADGLMASRTDAAGTTSYVYDGADRLKTLQNSTAGTNEAYAYDASSNVSKISYGSGNSRNFSYDALGRTTGDDLQNSAGTSIAKISYGWDANSNETSKTTSGFGGSTVTNTYGYDLANRLTSWNNGNTNTGYTYDASGNRTGNGSTTYTYDARNRLTGDSDGNGYMYTPRGTLASVVKGAVTTATTSDAFDQTATQSYTGGTQHYDYDALGRDIQTGFSYTGTGNDLAADASATYVRDPGEALVGTASGGTQREVWTDLHDDVVGQFTSASTALSGSTVYDPLGAIKSNSGMLGSFGYQSEWTDSFTGRVNMAARWYNTGTGQFDSRDTAANSPAPSSAAADRYAYGDDNPMTSTDPTGHWSFRHLVSSVFHPSSSSSSGGGSFWGNVWGAASNWGEGLYHATVAKAEQWGSDALAGVSYVANKVGAKGIAKAADKGRKHLAEKSQRQHREAERHYKEAARRGEAVKHRVEREYHKAVKRVKDVGRKAEKWAKKHQTLVKVLATVVTIAASVALGPVGGLVAGMAISVLQDGLSGNIHSWKDLGTSVLHAGESAALGELTGGLGGAIGGKLAGMAASKLGAGIIGRMAGGALAGGIGGGIADVGTQLLTTGHVNLDETAQAIGTGALVGGVTGGLSKGKDDDVCQVPHSFDPQTSVLMADGTTKPIGDVKLGDKVESTDLSTGKNKAEQVSVLHHNDDTDMAAVTVKESKTGKQSVLHTTQTHPFWNAGKKEWTKASDLKAGDKLRSPDGETTQTVVAIKVWTSLKWMDDLTVNDLHTYYVLAGNAPVLVHNCGGSGVTNGQKHSSSCQCATGGNAVLPPNPHGSRGSPAVRAQLDNVRDDFLTDNSGWSHTHGGRDAVTGDDLPEYYVPGPAGGVRGSSRTDLTFQHDESGAYFHINTVDTLADGKTPTMREVANMWRFHQQSGGHQVWMIPKG